MRRLDPHAIEGGAHGQILTTRLGEAQWQTFDINGDPQPLEVVGYSELSIQDSLYNDYVQIPIPAEVTPDFDGRFILVMVGATNDNIDVGFSNANYPSSWTPIAYTTGAGYDGLAIFGVPPQLEPLEFYLPGGNVWFVLIAVAGARGYRSIPLAATRLIAECDTVDGWTTSGPNPIEQVTTTPTPYGDYTYVQVRPDYLGDNMAELAWTPAGGTDMRDHVEVEVTYTFAGETSQDFTFEAYSGGVRLRSEATSAQHAYGATMRFTVPDGVLDDLTFRAGPFYQDGDYNRLRIWRLTAYPYPNGARQLNPGISEQGGQTATMPHGTDAVNSDLAVIVAAADSLGVHDYIVDTPGAALLVKRNGSDTTKGNHAVWTVPITADQSIQPTFTTDGGFFDAAVGVVRNTGAASGGGDLALLLDAIEDVETGGATGGDVLTFDGAKWVAQEPASGAELLGFLDDVDLTGLETGQLIMWNGTKWIPADPPAGTGTINLADLGDVDETAPTVGQALVWDGTEWKPATLPTGLDAEQVRDTVAAMLTQGSGVTITVDDAADTVTISASAPAPMTTEQVQDIVAAMLLEGTGVDLVYDDAAGTLTLTATGGGGGGATTLDQLTDVETAGAASGKVLTFDGAVWKPVTPTSGGATTLDALTDVTTPAPGDGYVLTYDLASGQWVPRPGGGAVGSWVSNRTVTYTLPAFAETDLTAAPLTVPPSSSPAVAQIQFTVTAPMLVTASDSGEAEPFGFATCIIVNASIDNRLAGNTTVWCETKINGIQAGLASGTGATNTQRGGIAAYFKDVKVGDVIEVRIWNSAAVTSKLDWWGRSSVPIRFGNKLPPGGGRYQFRDVNILARVPQPAPATVLPWLPVWTQDVGNDDVTYDLGAQISTQAPDVARTYVNDVATGVLSAFRAETQANSIQIMRSTTGAPIVEHNSFAQVRADRLAIPTPPA